MKDELTNQEYAMQQRSEAIADGYKIWERCDAEQVAWYEKRAKLEEGHDVSAGTGIPAGIWCTCGHISGHHGIVHPHKCAENQTCKCNEFMAAHRPSGIADIEYHEKCTKAADGEFSERCVVCGVFKTHICHNCNKCADDCDCKKWRDMRRPDE